MITEAKNKLFTGKGKDNGKKKRKSKKQRLTGATLPSSPAWHNVFPTATLSLGVGAGAARIERKIMFSVRQKREIADKVQTILRETNHPELPTGEIEFNLRVLGATPMSWADIKNNGAMQNPSVNPWNEQQDPESDLKTS